MIFHDNGLTELLSQLLEDTSRNDAPDPGRPTR
jgi:hypothetical protein